MSTRGLPVARHAVVLAPHARLALAKVHDVRYITWARERTGLTAGSQALSDADMTLLLHVDEAIKGEHYGALEAQHAMELKVERMKKTVLLMRKEIETVKTAIDEELAAQGADSEPAPES